MRKLILCLLLLLCTSCSFSTAENQTTCSLVFFDAENQNTTVAYDITLSSADNEDAIRKLYSLLAHPSKTAYVSAIPKNVYLTDARFLDSNCIISLSQSYSRLSADEKVPLNFALVNTMLSLPDTNRVTIICGNEHNEFTKDDFISQTPRTYYNSYLANLYYPSEDYATIIKLEETVPISPEKSLETSVTELLLNCSKKSGTRSPFPEGTVLNNVYLDGGTCVVDVSSKFISSAPHGQLEETNIINSIVNTLTELPKIDNVQFLIDGSEGYGYVYYDLSLPLANSTILQNT